jgi:hypothetical protein
MRRTLLILACAALPAMAQTFDAQVFLGRQSYNAFNRSGVEAKAEAKTVAALRFEAGLFQTHQLTFSAALQPNAKTRVDLWAGGLPLGSGDLEHEAWGLGVGYRYAGAVQVGVALDLRWDKLTDGDTRTTYDRPWLRAQVGWSPSGKGLRPVVGAEFALPLHTTNDDVDSPEAVLKSLAPSFQAGVYVGLRF